MRKKTSMKDIAQELGVSTALVSYVLNDKYTDRINVQTAKKIKELAASLNYTPNRIAQSLKRNETFTIGLIIADISNLFYSNIARFIENESMKNNYHVIFGSADENSQKFNRLVDVFLSRQVDGIILAAPANSEEKIKYLKQQGIPFVLIDRIFPGLKEINSVMIDNYQSSFDAVRHLSEKKFRRPILITIYSELHHLQERSRGFSEAVSALFKIDQSCVIEIEEGKLAQEMESVLMTSLSTEPSIDSVIFSTNKVAMEGLAVLAKHHVKVPEQLGIICFDEADAYRIFNTSITYIKQPLQKIGAEAVRVILSKIHGSDKIDNIILNTEIIENNSTAKYLNT